MHFALWITGWIATAERKQFWERVGRPGPWNSDLYLSSQLEETGIESFVNSEDSNLRYEFSTIPTLRQTEIEYLLIVTP